MGYLYLLCYERPLSDRHPRNHYLGYAAKSVNRRIAEHAAGTGRAVFTTEAHRLGIAFKVGGIWKDCTPNDERSMKNQKNHRRYCQVCRPDSQTRVPPKPKRKPEKRRVVEAPTVTTDRHDDLEDLPL